MSGGEVIDIEFEVTMEDVVGMCTALYYKKYDLKTTLTKITISNLKQMVIGLAVGFPVIFILLFIKFNYEYQSVLQIIFLVLNSYFLYSVMAIFFMISLAVSFAQVGCRSCVARTCKKNLLKLMKKGHQAFLFCKCNLSISADGLKYLTPYQKTELFWSSIASVRVLEGFFRCENLDGSSAVFIPSRFFKSEEEKQRVYAQCLTWWKSAQEKAA